MKKRSRFAKQPLTQNHSEAKNESTDEVDYLTLVVEDVCSKAPRLPHHTEESPHPKKNVLQIMDEAREEALRQPIAQENKGFKLLMKFGYAGSGGLGKDSDGLVQPLTVKRDDGVKLGVGVAEQAKRKVALTQAQKEAQATSREQMLKSFLSRSSSEAEWRQCKSAVFKCERAIQDLDERADVDRHILWPEEARDCDDIIESGVTRIRSAEVSRDSGESRALMYNRLADCVEYLRGCYCYCVFCGAQYDSQEDLTASCPGPFLQDH